MVSRRFSCAPFEVVTTTLVSEIDGFILRIKSGIKGGAFAVKHGCLAPQSSKSPSTVFLSIRPEPFPRFPCESDFQLAYARSL
jgi:hypothetical protein